MLRLYILNTSAAKYLVGRWQAFGYVALGFILLIVGMVVAWGESDAGLNTTPSACLVVAGLTLYIVGLVMAILVEIRRYRTAIAFIPKLLSGVIGLTALFLLVLVFMGFAQLFGATTATHSQATRTTFVRA